MSNQRGVSDMLHHGCLGGKIVGTCSQCAGHKSRKGPPCPHCGGSGFTLSTCTCGGEAQRPSSSGSSSSSGSEGGAGAGDGDDTGLVVVSCGVQARRAKGGGL